MSYFRSGAKHEMRGNCATTIAVLWRIVKSTANNSSMKSFSNMKKADTGECGENSCGIVFVRIRPTNQYVCYY